MPSGTTVVFVPGAWHDPSAFSEVAKCLHDADYKVAYVGLASVDASPPLKDFSADVFKIRAVVEPEVRKGQEVILVVHSYGGIPACEAVEGLDLASRKKAGKPGGVAHIFFCCSFLVPEGKSLSGAFGGQVLPWWKISSDEKIVTCNDPKNVFYNDIEDKLAAEMIDGLKPHSYKTFFSPVTYAAWKHVPSTYLYCTKDNAIPIDIQKMMVEQTAEGVDIKTDTLDCGHSPFLSKPKEMAESIRRAAGETQDDIRKMAEKKAAHSSGKS